MLKLKDIKKDYVTAGSVVHALKGVSLEFRANEFVSILGASGCGKTTLLNIIGGLDHSTSGDLIIRGVSTKDYTDRDWDVYRNHRIGFVFQSYNLIPHQTVLENVELALTIAGCSKAERKKRAADALKRVGLGDHLNKRPNQLSGGQMQRVAIARALVNNPEILLADEPTGALDSTTSVQIMDLIREIAGERLVIMVTHNPELAEKYSTRIVRLQDGLVVSDSNPYDSAAERKVLEAKLKEKGITPEQVKLWKQKKLEREGAESERAAMSLKTSLGLSARNLNAKRGRTVITSIAGSIGIIGVSLVLALSGGFNNYIADTEKDMLSAYPIQINEMAFDYTSIMNSMAAGNKKVDISQLDDKIYVNSFLTKLANGAMNTNTITQDYIDYLNGLDPSNYYALQYTYGGDISNNIYSEFQFETEDGTPFDLDMSLNTILDLYKTKLMSDEAASEYASLASMFSTVQSVTYELPECKDYILSQYDIMAGEYPTSSDELVLVLNNDGGMTDIVLAQLGLITTDEFLALFQTGNDDSPMMIDFERLMSHTYSYYENDEIYSFNPQLNGGEGGWLYTGFSGESFPGGLQDKDAKTLKIGCILRAKEGTTYGSLDSGLAYTKAFSDEYRESSLKSKIVTEEKNSKVINVYYYDLYELASNPENQSKALRSKETTVRELGGGELPNQVKIYVKDFEHKDVVTDYLDYWNEVIQKDNEALQIQYTDTVAIMMTLIRSMLDAVTYVLVAFTAISLIVSSVMIGVITYVSVVERTKEIGVLRSLGARKKDIRHLFNAETFLIGLFAGAIGVGVTYLLSIPINLLLGHLTGISTLAALPVWQGLVMIGVSIVLTLISGLVPAQSAAKKDPVIALRTE